MTERPTHPTDEQRLDALLGRVAAELVAEADGLKADPGAPHSETPLSADAGGRRWRMRAPVLAAAALVLLGGFFALRDRGESVAVDVGPAAEETDPTVDDEPLAPGDHAFVRSGEPGFEFGVAVFAEPGGERQMLVDESGVPRHLDRGAARGIPLQVFEVSDDGEFARVGLPGGRRATMWVGVEDLDVGRSGTVVHVHVDAPDPDRAGSGEPVEIIRVMRDGLVVFEEPVDHDGSALDLAPRSVVEFVGVDTERDARPEIHIDGLVISDHGAADLTLSAGALDAFVRLVAPGAVVDRFDAWTGLPAGGGTREPAGFETPPVAEMVGFEARAAVIGSRWRAPERLRAAWAVCPGDLGPGEVRHMCPLRWLEDPEPNGPYRHLVADGLDPAVEVAFFDDPGGEARTLLAVDPVTGASMPYPVFPVSSLGEPLVLRVLDGEPGDEWVQVQSPSRPARRAVWVRSDGFAWGASTLRIEIDVTPGTDGELVVLDGETEVHRVGAISFGRTERPTAPHEGLVEQLVFDAHESVGPYAGAALLTFGAWSETMSDFGGGMPGQSLHGTNVPETIGHPVTAGGVRVPNDDIAAIAALDGIVGARVVVHHAPGPPDGPHPIRLAPFERAETEPYQPGRTPDEAAPIVYS